MGWGGVGGGMRAVEATVTFCRPICENMAVPVHQMLRHIMTHQEGTQKATQWRSQASKQGVCPGSFPFE